MARWAIGDLQGCCDEFEELLQRIHFSADRDQIWLVGDLVNRGPQSLKVLQLTRSLGAAAICVLGNHDLHLLAIALGDAKVRKHDTLNDVLQSPQRDQLIDWLLQRPLVHHDAAHADLLLHAGVVPQWTLPLTLQLAQEVEQALRSDPRSVLRHMYGDEPDRWRDGLEGRDRLRFAINVLTRLRFCSSAGRIDLKQKGQPDSVQPPWIPWFLANPRAAESARIVFGHWSALGLYRGHHVLGLDTGCVWGGRLTAVNLDDTAAEPVSVASRQPKSIGE